MSVPNAFAPRCPTCDMQVDVKISTKSLPFCSERCRLIDLGRWLNEEHALPCDTSDEEEESNEAAPSTSRLPPGWHDA